MMSSSEFNEKNSASAARTVETKLSSATLNWRELLSIKAMTSYVAHNQNVPEPDVRAFVEAAFRVADLEGLRRDQFDRVIAFLVDLNGELLAH